MSHSLSHRPLLAAIEQLLKQDAMQPSDVSINRAREIEHAVLCKTAEMIADDLNRLAPRSSTATALDKHRFVVDLATQLDCLRLVIRCPETELPGILVLRREPGRAKYVYELLAVRPDGASKVIRTFDAPPQFSFMPAPQGISSVACVTLFSPPHLAETQHAPIILPERGNASGSDPCSPIETGSHDEFRAQGSCNVGSENKPSAEGEAVTRWLAEKVPPSLRGEFTDANSIVNHAVNQCIRESDAIRQRLRQESEQVKPQKSR